MSLRSRIALVILLLPAPLGCAKPWLNAVKPQPTANALKQDESTSPQTTEGERILALFAASGEPVAFRNPPLPPGAVDPLANATHLYSRARSKNPRSSAMDIEVWLLESAGRPLHANHATAQCRLCRGLRMEPRDLGKRTQGQKSARRPARKNPARSIGLVLGASRAESRIGTLRISRI
jgi:hypothetical protein